MRPTERTGARVINTRAIVINVANKGTGSQQPFIGPQALAIALLFTGLLIIAVNSAAEELPDNPSANFVYISAEDGSGDQLVINDANSAFSDIWFQQHSNNYSYQEGGDAAEKIFRLGIQTLYKNYRNNIPYGDKLPNEKGNFRYSPRLDYGLGVSSNKLKFAIEYQF